MKRTIILFLTLIFLISFIPANAAETKCSGMFDLYEKNRKEKIPNYITEDFLVLSYSMMLSESITQLEESYLYPRFSQMVEDLIKKIESEETKDEIAKANLNYMGVIDSLLSGEEKPKHGANPDMVAKEIEAVMKAGGISVSKLMHQKIDYSQFKVRGKYTKTKALSRYFRAMRYAGTVLFPVLESKGTGITKEQADKLTRQAIALMETIYNDKELKKTYTSLTKSLSWLFGPPDDMVMEDYRKIREKHEDAKIEELRKALLAHAKEEGLQPRIIGGIVDVAALKKEKGKKADVMTGLRFIPQGLTPDGAAFQQLVFDRVKKLEAKKTPFSSTVINNEKVKGFPLGLELMALLGSEKAEKTLQDSGDQAYEGYKNAYKAAGKVLGESVGMAKEHMAFMKYWLSRGERVQYEKNDARRLTTMLGFWTYNRYSTQLYTKQSYTAVAKSFGIPGRDTAWIEPLPVFYLQLKDLGNDLKKGFKPFSKDIKKMERVLKNIDSFTEIMDRCIDISNTEIDKKPLSEKDIRFLNSLDKALLTLAGGEDKPIVVDVHTDPSSKKVLEEALGFPEIVEREIGEKKVPARGALFNYYEFKYNMDNRLTDAEWMEILQSPDKLKKLEFSPGSARK